MEIYEKLSEIYDRDWGEFAHSYIRYISYLKKTKNEKLKSILDIGCGTGELVNELYKFDYKVKGLDISNEMLKKAKTKNNNIEYINSDLISFNLDERFDLITCTFDVINYILDRSDLLKVFENVYNHLNDNGYFLFDFNTPILYEANHSGVIERDFFNDKIYQILSYDRKKRIASTIIKYSDKKQEVHLQKSYTISEMKEMLKDSNFSLEKAYKDFEFSEADRDTKKAIFLAKRN